MFDRLTFSSPGKASRKLVILIGNAYDIKQPEDNLQRQLAVNDEKEPEEFRSAQLSALNIDSIKAILDDTIKKLDDLTRDYLNHIKPVASKILENWPIDILKTLTTIRNPLVGLSLTVANESFLFDCQTLQQNISSHINLWCDNPDKKIVFKKLHYATAIYHYLHDPDLQGVAKILAIKAYLEKTGCKELRVPRTPGVQPGNTHGGHYIKAVITIQDTCCVAIENLYSHSNFATLNRQTIIRLEWICLHYLNFLADKILLLLSQLKLQELISLEEKSSPHVKDNRFIAVEQTDADGVTKEFKIHCSVLLASVDIFPAYEHYYFHKSSAALELLEHIEEVNPKTDIDKLNGFFDLIKSEHINEYFSKKPPCNWRFWKTDNSVSVTAAFLANISKIQNYYNGALLNFPEETALLTQTPSDNSLFERRCSPN